MLPPTCNDASRYGRRLYTFTTPPSPPPFYTTCHTVWNWNGVRCGAYLCGNGARRDTGSLRYLLRCHTTTCPCLLVTPSVLFPRRRAPVARGVQCNYTNDGHSVLHLWRYAPPACRRFGGMDPRSLVYEDVDGIIRWWAHSQATLPPLQTSAVTRGYLELLWGGELPHYSSGRNRLLARQQPSLLWRECSVNG